VRLLHNTGFFSGSDYLQILDKNPRNKELQRIYVIGMSDALTIAPMSLERRGCVEKFTFERDGQQLVAIFNKWLQLRPDQTLKGDLQPHLPADVIAK